MAPCSPERWRGRFIFTGGTFTTGSWDLAQGLTNTSGTFSPGTGGAHGGGLAFGTTTFTASGGNYTQLAGGHLAINLLNNTPGNKDYIDIGAGAAAGVAALAGTIDVTLDPGFSPNYLDTFEILTADTITNNSFAVSSNTVNGYHVEFDGIYAGGNGQVLRLVAVPEPSTTALLLVFTIVGLGARVPTVANESM